MNEQLAKYPEPKTHSKKFRFSIAGKILATVTVFGVLPLIFALLFSIQAYEAAFRAIIFSGVVLVGHSVQDDLDKVLELVGLITLAVFLASSSLILIAYLISTSFIKPILDLRKAFGDLSAGKRNVRVPVRNHDEFGDLAQHFNEMSEYIDKANEQEEKMNKLKSEFISIAAHQLRAPLSGIKWTFRMLLDEDWGAMTSEQKQAIERASTANERLIALVNELLDVSRIEEGRIGYNFKSAYIEKIIESVKEEFYLIALGKNIKLEFIHSPAPIPLIAIDEERIGLAINNLLSNAINYTLAGGKITIKSEALEEEIRVSITDTGVGIPKDEIKKLFVKFFRASNVIRMQSSGTGLGLFIVKNIIERHGGKIWAESQEGHGSVFTFTIPFKQKDSGFVPEIE
ncbi:MAG: hypothetical protein A3A80_02185 [Candidatus Terrybacteria bacterium RIFCSPLOWO2_01_FULL_44_24]|uniref:histidine kinase n=1 Tax=Candidatus Terrybacteria bacterium RIFCSPHIGHO2_01_FULL_43_35 TaxID=1802361 RepID=A0A1G2PGA4_9BACT|nr:MAG: hypothetical protein A2828_01975 [Candidatus Terrybacteria bacterium RIFCSPHIGHO2_01_FULL_43_35]OHA50889.1 MAG: hypothetical protein A3A80_02185 [Candidatus Terrybacteria bacterium RIFCSPLOWO2_01_FULL_44_24]